MKARLTEVVPQQQAFLVAGAIVGLTASFVRAPTEVNDLTRSQVLTLNIIQVVQ